MTPADPNNHDSAESQSPDNGEKLHTIWGVLWRIQGEGKEAKRQRWVNVSIQLGDTGRFTNTDNQGRYRFDHLQPDFYQLIIRRLAKPPAVGEKLADGPWITVPASYQVVVPATTDPLGKTSAEQTTTQPGSEKSATSEEPAGERTTTEQAKTKGKAK